MKTLSTKEAKALRTLSKPQKKEEKVFNWKKIFHFIRIADFLSFFKKKGIGDISDTRCKAGTHSKITRKTCRNQCRYWNGKNCGLGY